MTAKDNPTPTASTKAERAEAEERASPGGHILYLAVQNEGEHELERTNSALAWSGLAAGLSMGFSLLSEGLLRAHLPDAPWRPLIAKFGYSLGFLIVILGRQQLFTENTLTVILPLLRKRTFPILINVARLWAVVLGANLVGAFIFAIVLGNTNAVGPEIRQAITEIAREAYQSGAGTVFLRGIFAGWLIALMVWLLPFAESGRVWVIILLTYIVGLAQFSHIIAGSVDALYLVGIGEKSFATYLFQYMLPTLLGNILGGVSLVAAFAHAQFISRLTEKKRA
ncbi:MAG TPA: formate/nitrite transporter family protein [Chthoniobacteraceae bacterium]|jgi:formate/nitrite transporter FocA (FNT family)|nr:formate/nitrite transporter family protein [Chthoniobacteraceae bacterium]